MVLEEVTLKNILIFLGATLATDNGRSMTSPRSPPNAKMDKSLVVNMLKFEATTKDSHLPPITRSVVEEMVHKTEARIRPKPAIKAVPDTVKLYQKMKKRGIFTIGLSADSTVEDNSFKIETKGFNLSNIPDNMTYTRAKQNDEVWIDVKKADRPKKSEPRHFQDDGLMWPKYTRNNTMILPKLSYGLENRKMKSLVPPEAELNGAQEPEVNSTKAQDRDTVPQQADVSASASVDDRPQEKKKDGEKSSIAISLISIGQEGKPANPDPPNKNEKNKQPSSATIEKDTPRPGPVLRQVTIGIDIPDPNPDTKKKKEIRSMYPMYDSIEDKKEKQRHNWWEKPQRSPTHVQKTNTNISVQQQNHQNAIFLAPIPKPHPGIVDNNKTETMEKLIKVIVPNKEYVNADEMERNAMRKTSEDYLNMPGVFDKHLEVVKTIARGGQSVKSQNTGQIDLSPQITSLTPAPKLVTVSTPSVPSVPPPSAATVALTEENTFHKMESTAEEDSISGPVSVAPSIGPNAEPVAKVEIAISGERVQQDGDTAEEKAEQENGEAAGTGVIVNVGNENSLDSQQQLSHRESLSTHSQHSGHGDDDRPGGPKRRTSSFLELPSSPLDPGELPPSIEGDDKDSKQTATPAVGEPEGGAHQTPRRRTSSFLEPPGSQCDPLERPPSKSDSVEFNPQDDTVFGEHSPRLSRRPTPEILVSTEAEKLEVAQVIDADTEQAAE
jgi:hypothetical protein